MKSFFLVLAILSASIAVAQNNAVPFINQPLNPDTHIASGIGFTLTVHGTGFVSGSVVNWNGSPRTTTFVSDSKLQAAVLATDVTKTGTASIAVTSPTPGGGTSNVVYFPVHKSETTVALARRDHLLTDYDAPGGLVTGDFNNDGHVDVVVSQTGSPMQIQTFLGNGNGTFQNPVTTTLYDDDIYPVAMISGDFNGDGKLDVITLDNEGDGQVFLGNGAGGFTGQGSFGVAASSRWAATGDFNGDGKLDLVTVGNNGLPYATVYLGNGNGTFTYSTSLILVNGAGTPAVGDFNRDGKLDLAIPDTDADNNPTVDIFLGNGDGTFQQPVAYSAAYYGDAVATADVNGDGKLDLVTDGVSVLLGNGNGTFTSAGGVLISPDSYGPLLADMNNDGILDVVVTGNANGAAIQVLLGNGNGTFQNPLLWNTGLEVSSTQTSLGDFNNDGLLDVAAINYDLITGLPQFSTLLQSTLNISPTYMGFASLKVGTTSPPQTATITNTGTTAIPISSPSLTGTNPLDFALITTCGTSLSAGASCTVTVTFTPIKKRNINATVKVVYSGVGSPQYIELAGYGD